MEYLNGKPSSALSEAVDYTRVLHSGVPQEELESLLREHDRAKHEEISSLRRQIGELSATNGARPSPAAPDRSGDLRAEISQMRQELANAMASIRGLLVDGDSGLHEMQLTSLRRQVSQLEGVLESNYQRELRVAEDRESALRSEMAQMRQDLRVALETLYRMPAEEGTAGESIDLKPIEDQITKLGATFFHVSSEQQAQAIEREGTLKAELALMRRDLLVTLEASYQLPTDRVEALDSQVAAWRTQVEDMQRIIRGLQESQDAASIRQQSTLQADLDRFRQEVQTTLLSSLPQSEHEELLAQRAIMTQLAERLDAQASGAGSHFAQLSELVSGQSSALKGELERLEAQVESLSLPADRDSVLELLAARETALADELATLQRDVTAIVETVSAPAVASIDHSADLSALRDSLTALGAEFSQIREEQRSLLQSYGQAVREELASSQGDHAVDLSALRDSVTVLRDGVSEIREEQRSLLQAHSQAVRDELAASQEAILEASRALRDSSLDVPTLTAEDIAEMIAGRLAEVEAHWSTTQTEVYRQLVSQMAEIQSDLDLMNTGMQAIQPVETDTLGLQSSVLDKVNLILEHQQMQGEEDRDSHATDDLSELRIELHELRAELREALGAQSRSLDEAAISTRDFSLDDVVQVIAAQLQAARAEEAQLAATRHELLQREFAQMRQEVQAAAQQAPPIVSQDGAQDAFIALSAVQSDIAQIRDNLTLVPRPDAGELRTEILSMRQDLHEELEALRTVPQPPNEVESAKQLAERVAELERALQASQEDQQRRLAERDEMLLSRLGDLRASLTETISESRSARDADAGDSWHAELVELRAEIASLASRPETSDTRDDSSIVELVTAVRSEMREMLENVRTSSSGSAVGVPDVPGVQDGLTALAVSIQQAAANQDRLLETQQQNLQAAIAQMRDELQAAVSGISRESVDSFEKRQSQLRMDQLEMERNLAQLRQELVVTQADPGNKKKLWR